MASEKVTCVAWNNSTPDDICSKPADVQLTVGCVHEHISTADMCNEHLGLLTEPFCRLCYDLATEGHFCDLVIKITKEYSK